MWDKVHNKITSIAKTKTDFAVKAKQLLSQKATMEKSQWDAQSQALIMEYERSKSQNGKEQNNPRRVQGIDNKRLNVGGLQQGRGNGNGGGIPGGSSGVIQRGSDGRQLSRNGNGNRHGVLTATEEMLQIKEVDGTSFFNALKAAKKRFSYDKCVSLHEISEYNEMQCLLSASGEQGFAVAKDGDIVSVFNSAGKKIRGATKIMLPMAIKMGGKKLDCYNIKGGLLKVYSKFGFVPVVRVPFDRQYNPDFPHKYGKPDVLIMAHNGDTAEQVKKKYGTYEVKDTSQVPIEPDYDNAMKMRDDYLYKNRFLTVGFSPKI